MRLGVHGELGFYCLSFPLLLLIFSFMEPCMIDPILYVSYIFLAFPLVEHVFFLEFGIWTKWIPMFRLQKASIGIHYLLGFRDLFLHPSPNWWRVSMSRHDGLVVPLLSRGSLHGRACRAVYSLLHASVELGFFISRPKRSLLPVHRVVYLGIGIDTV